MRNSTVRSIALGGVLAALATVIMSMGTLIPAATYVCPMLSMMTLQVVLKSCGSQIAWSWYAAVAILSLLLCPDKEAAAVFLFLGYYPILKPRFDGLKLKVVWKLLFFNAVTLVMYWLLIHLFGMAAVAEEFEELGIVMSAALLVMGNVTFFLVDKLLGMKPRKRG